MEKKNQQSKQSKQLTVADLENVLGGLDSTVSVSANAVRTDGWKDLVVAGRTYSKIIPILKVD